MDKLHIIISIIGTSNTGKSSIFNFFAGKNFSTTNNHILTTRDRTYNFLKLNEYILKLVDTPGLFVFNNDSIRKKIFTQCYIAIKESHIILIVLDVNSFSNNDINIINFCSNFNKPIILIINKIEKHLNVDFYKSLIKVKEYNKYYISIKHGRGLFLLMNAIYSACLTLNKQYFNNISYKLNTKNIVKVSIIGQSNVGKSTFLNTLLQKERHLVFDGYFTTTDPILTTFIYKNFKILFTDTAGINNNSKNSFENIFINFSKQIINISNMVIFITDIYKVMSRDDKRIISILIKSYKPFIIVINKIDLVKKHLIFIRNVKKKFSNKLITHVNFISSISLNNVFYIILKIIYLFKKSKINIVTNLFNKVLYDIIKKKQHPLINKKPLKIYFGKQIANFPLSFIIYTNVSKLRIKNNYQRFLEHTIKKKFHIINIPIKLYFLKKTE